MSCEINFIEKKCSNNKNWKNKVEKINLVDFKIFKRDFIFEEIKIILFW